MSTISDNFLIKHGVSESLAATLQCLEEATLEDGSSRYHPSAVFDLRKQLLTRNYRDDLHRLAHLLALIYRCNQNPAEVFWMTNAINGHRLMEAINEWGTTDSEIENNRLIIKLDNSDYAIYLGDINRLAAWVELLFLIDTNLILENSGWGLTTDAVRHKSNSLQRSVYAYLKDNLQPQSQQEEALAWLNWLKSKDMGLGTLDDDQVLSFWEDHWYREDLYFKRFQSVADSAVTLNATMTEYLARQEVLTPLNLDDLGDFNEDAGDLLENYAASEELDAGLAESFATIPDIKFMTKKDLTWLADIECYVDQIPCLSKTLSRREIFGKQQNLITGAIQNSQIDRLPMLIDCEDTIDADALTAQLDKVVDKLDQVSLALLHIFNQFDESESELSDSQRADCAAAFKQINRAGFQTLPEVESLASYQSGALLVERARNMARVLRETTTHYAEEDQAEDKMVFSKLFSQIYSDRMEAVEAL